MIKSTKVEGTIRELSNEDYHGNKTHYSSTQLKMLLKDTEQFHNEYILGNKAPQVSRAAFDEGSYAHSLILEPHLVAKEYAFFEGWTKRGKDWEAFKEENAGKIILSKPQKTRTDALHKAYLERDVAIKLMEGCESEKSLFVDLYKIPTKVRCDAINVEKGYIVDVKTTSFPTDVESFRATINQYMYQLSAALYCMAFEKHYNRSFDFYFIVLGKKDKTCEVYKMSKHTLQEGKGMVMEAINIYKRCMESGDWTKHGKSVIASKEDYEILEV